MGTEPQVQVQEVQVWHRTGPKEAEELSDGSMGLQADTTLLWSGSLQQQGWGMLPSLGWLIKMLLTDTQA